jgi:DNA-binding NarL/FixJ family response regulator
MNSDQPVLNVLIADSQFLIVEALKSFFHKEQKYLVLGVVESKFQLEKALDELDGGILIIDFWSIDFADMEDVKSFALKFQKIKFLILTNSITKSEFAELTKAGFKNIIYKTADRDELMSALESTAKGKKYYSSLLLDMILEMNSAKQTLEESKTLTSSEIEIVKLISQGLTTKEIALHKNISFHTVNTHRKNIFRKMSVSNVSELVIQAIKQGWIDNIEYYI